MSADPDRGFLVTLSFRAATGSTEIPGKLRSGRPMKVCRLHELGVDSVTILEHRTEYLFQLVIGFRESAFREDEAAGVYEASLRVVERLVMYRFLPRGLERIPPSSALYFTGSGVPSRYDAVVDPVREIGTYYFLTSWPEGGLSLASSVLLDTNVLVDIERFFYSRIPTELRRDLQMLLLAILEKDVLPGPALLESCRSRPGASVDYAKLGRSEYAFQIVSHWSHEELAAMFARDRPPAELYPSPPLEVDEFEAGGGLLFHLMQTGGLATLLKVQTLTPHGRGFAGPEERIAALRSFVGWTIDSLKFAMPHEFQIAHDWFVGPPDRRTYVQRLLKFGHKDALRATWGAVWDLSFLRFVDSGSSMDSALDNLVLVTRDRGLRALRQYCFSTGSELMDANPDAPTLYGSMYASLIDVDPRLASREEEIWNIWTQVPTAQMLRLHEYRGNSSIGEMEKKVEHWRREALLFEDELRGKASSCVMPECGGRPRTAAVRRPPAGPALRVYRNLSRPAQQACQSGAGRRHAAAPSPAWSPASSTSWSAACAAA
jgi:hypothetical protein